MRRAHNDATYARMMHVSIRGLALLSSGHEDVARRLSAVDVPKPRVMVTTPMGLAREEAGVPPQEEPRPVVRARAAMTRASRPAMPIEMRPIASTWC